MLLQPCWDKLKKADGIEGPAIDGSIILNGF
jgi:hypothetical protein